MSDNSRFPPRAELLRPLDQVVAAGAPGVVAFVVGQPPDFPPGSAWSDPLCWIIARPGPRV